MNEECTFNADGANRKLVEEIKNIYDKLNEEYILTLDDKFNIFKSFFEGLEIGLGIGITYSGNMAYLTPDILVRIRFIVTHVPELGTNLTRNSIGHVLFQK